MTNIDFIQDHILLTEHINRWNNKAEQYTNNENVPDLQNVFDEYISRYIVLAAYSNILKHGTRKGDRTACTTLISNFLTASTDRIINDIIDSINQLIEPLKEQHLYLKSYPNLDRAVRHHNPSKILLALLNVLYDIRCNIFHGEKEFSQEQMQLLQPANHSLKVINQHLEIQFDEQYGSQHQ